ncbi:MAG: LacI family DNA-binding transcriptional regulator, partial [Anaerolineae bacterium]|nr:LacI family transcriptional regulator [Caldilineales bacterium]MDW8268232.1 LacI family DNA-binding transcriptional regulator [Anaerolineae bacterium]
MPDRPTILDVARLAGVSKSTVSRVLQGKDTPVSEKARAKVQQAIAALGYEHNAVASSLRTDRTCMMMLIIPDITNPFWPEVARGLQDTVEQAGYSVVFANSDWDPLREMDFLRMARRNRFDAIAINPTRVTNDELRTSGIPTVILGLRDDFPDFDMVGSDTHQGTLAALEHLYALGHRRIGVIHGLSQRRLVSSARRKGHEAFLRRTGLPFDPSLVVEVP